MSEEERLIWTREGHVVYIRIDDKYRLGDTNVGLLDFSESEHPEEELYACFKALMTSHYPDNDYVAGVKLWV